MYDQGQQLSVYEVVCYGLTALERVLHGMIVSFGSHGPVYDGFYVRKS